MKTTPFPSPRWNRRPSGSALIICLSMVVIMTILLVGYVTTARNERTNASTHFAGQKAQIFSEMAANHSRATLLAAFDKTSAPTGIEFNFATGPGRIVRLPSTPNESPKEFDLTSGTDGSATVTSNVTIGMNTAGLLSSKGAFLPASSNVFPVRWIYVRKDGALETGAVPAYNKSNPIIGRYAFYTDDESARINLNTAWTRDAANSNGANHPSKIDLRGAIGDKPEEAVALNDYRLSRLFASPLAALGVDNTPTLRTVLTDNPSSFTHFSYTRNKNLFGKTRRVLTTKKIRAGAEPYFDILNDENADPGLYSNINAGKVQAIFNEIYTLLKRTDWPMLPGKSFVDKYGPFATAQTTLDIIEYIRSCESGLAIVEPIRGTFNQAAGTFTVNSGASAADSIIGNSRRLLVTEAAVEWPKDPKIVDQGQNPPTKEYHVKYRVELYYPESHLNLGGTVPPPVNLATTKLYIHKPLNFTGASYEQQIALSELQAIGNAKKDLTMNPGDYRVVERTVVIPAELIPSPLPTQIGIRLAIGRNAAPDCRYNVCPIDSTFTNTIPYTLSPGTPIAQVESVSPDDPRVNNTAADWKQGSSSFGGPSGNSTLGKAPTASPEQDTAGGMITNNSMGYPLCNTPISSAGILGFVHTGVSGPTAGTKGTPWRSIRLQPKNDPQKTMLPDWAMLDLFAAPMANATVATQPRPDSTGGLVNLNTSFYPFTDSNKPAERPLPLKTLLLNAVATMNATGKTAISDARAQTLASNIINKKLAAQGTDYSNMPANNTPFYAYPGELLEVEGMADGGEESEAIAREILSLATTRSNVFRVYTIGQSVNQSSTGNITVIAEQKTVKLLEPENSEIKVIYEQDWGL